MTMPAVPTKLYARQYAELWPELGPALERAFLHEDPVLGEPVAAFERAFASHTGTAHAVGVNSGTDALLLTLRALGIGPGDEVITAANTFIATVTAIVAAGARPVLVEPDPESMTIDPQRVADAIGPRTRAVIPVHLYGRTCAMAALDAVVRGTRIAMVEDAAQAHGARDLRGRRAGALGRAGAFSFHPSKNLGAFGDAGAVTTDDPYLDAKLRMLRNLGKRGKYEVRALAPNSKLDTIQAVVLAVKLRHLDAWNRRRRAFADLYRRRLLGVGDLRVPDPGPGEHVFHLFVVRTPQRDELARFLRARGIQTGLHYPVPPHPQPLDVDLGYRPGDLPVTERLASEVLSLPISHELAEDEIEQVCVAVEAFFG